MNTKGDAPDDQPSPELDPGATDDMPSGRYVTGVTPLSSARRLGGLAALTARLTASMSGTTDEGDVVERYYGALKSLAADAAWTVRLLEPSTGESRLARSDAPLPPELHERISLSRAALDAAQASCPPAVQITPEYKAIRATMGFDVALVDGNEVVGVVTCEHEGSRPVLRPEAQIVCSSFGAMLGRARLMNLHAAVGVRVASMLRSAPIPLVVTGAEGHVLCASEMMCALLGDDNLEGKSFLLSVAEEDRDRVSLALRHSTSAECDMLGTERVRMRFDFIDLNEPALGLRGRLAIGRDVRPLEQLRRQVLHVEKLATVGQLAAGVAHELNNPLTSIAVYGETLRNSAVKEGRSDEEIDRLTRIMEGAERIRRFTQSLVAYARPSSGSPKPVDIANVIDESLGFCEHIIREVDARVRVRADDRLPSALGVRSSLHQVFVNLITNACHAMPRGRGVLDIRASAEDECIVVEVQDNGDGVPAKNIERIFEPFFSTKGEGRGTGLGLSIVRNILELHGGSISLRSEPGKGSCFRVRLPIATD